MSGETGVHTVLVPGLLCSPRLYEPVLEALWTFGPTTIADTRRRRSMGELAEDLLAAAPARFALAGLSMGGYVALEVMRRAPERVTALALLSTSARPDTPEQTASRHQQVAMVEGGRFDELVEAAFAAIVAPANLEDRDLRRAWRAMASAVGPEAFCRQQGAIVGRSDARPTLPRIACPALVLHGNDDQLIDAENARETAAGIPDARLVLLDGCGHSPTWEQPRETAAALTALLTACG